MRAPCQGMIRLVLAYINYSTIPLSPWYTKRIQESYRNSSIELHLPRQIFIPWSIVIYFISLEMKAEPTTHIQSYPNANQTVAAIVVPTKSLSNQALEAGFRVWSKASIRSSTPKCMFAKSIYSRSTGEMDPLRSE